MIKKLNPSLSAKQTIMQRSKVYGVYEPGKQLTFENHENLNLPSTSPVYRSSMYSGQIWVNI